MARHVSHPCIDLLAKREVVFVSHLFRWYRAASPTNEQLDQDIQLLKEGGTNFVRGAHYPQDPRWLDRMDENGMIVWSETLGPGVSMKDVQNATFLKYQAQQIEEMIDNAMNHPSIAFWGLFNEGPSRNAEACSAYHASSDKFKERDSTRLVTYASDAKRSDKCFAAADVVSINSYPGWYFKTDPSKYWSDLASDIKAGMILPETLGKPFLISETGAAGIYEWSHNTTASLWTLEYQKQVLIQDVDVAIANPNISGISLWHFFDFKADDQWENNTHCDYIPEVYPPTCQYISVNSTLASGRPGGKNHKGSLDFWRRTKPGFYAVAERYNATKHHLPRNVSVSES